MKYKLCLKQNDSAINKVSATSIEEATEYFRTVKRLNVENFNTIFRVLPAYD